MLYKFGFRGLQLNSLFAISSCLLLTLVLGFLRIDQLLERPEYLLLMCATTPNPPANVPSPRSEKLDYEAHVLQAQYFISARTVQYKCKTFSRLPLPELAFEAHVSYAEYEWPSSHHSLQAHEAQRSSHLCMKPVPFSVLSRVASHGYLLSVLFISRPGRSNTPSTFFSSRELARRSSISSSK